MNKPVNKLKKTGFYLLSLTLLFLLIPGQAFAQDRDLAQKLDAVPQLTLNYKGQGARPARTHKVGLPPEGTIRVYWFWAATCPCSRRAEPLVTSLIRNHPDVEFILVHSNANEDAKQGARVAKERSFRAPIYRDEGAHLAIAFDARITPEAVVLDSNGIIYRGRTDAPMRRGQIRDFISEVLEQVKSDGPVSPASRASSGCPIQRP